MASTTIRAEKVTSMKFFSLLPNFFVFQTDFLWTMDRDKNGHDGLNGQEWTDEWTMDNGQWTEIMYLSGLIPTSPIRPIRPIRRRKQQTKPRFCVPFHPSKQQPYKFSEFSVLSVDKKWVVGVSPRQAFSCGSWLKKS